MNIATIMISSVVIIAFLGLGAIVFLPEQVHVERKKIITGMPKQILELAASNEGYQKFNPYLTEDPNLLIRKFGPETGIGSGFYFDGKDGKGSQTVAEITNDTVKYDIDLGLKGKPTQSISAVVTDNGTLVTWSAHMKMGMNPIARLIGLFMDSMIGPTFELGLDNLEAAV
ncbi:MAG: hypothetical protein MI743_06605 [Sneathiellales bacterium]|nr:hypothetical protein [Sneathiellales bacterium]